MRSPLNIFFLLFLAILIYILKRENEGIVADEERSDQVHQTIHNSAECWLSSLDTHTLTRSELWTVVPKPSATCKIWVIPSASSPAWCRTPASTTARASSRMSGQSSASTIPTSMTSPENSSSTGSGSHGWQTTSWGQWSTILPQYC